MIIGIDCGHTISGQGTGAVGNGYKEQDLTRSLGKEVMNLFKQEGHTIIDCTVDKSSSNSQQLIDRVKKANKQKLDLFISIHFNAGCGTGVECLVSHKGTKAYDEAQRVCEKISKLGYKNRGVKVHGAYVIKNTVAPAFLIETCFIDSKSDMALYTKNVNNVAKAIVEGVLNKTIININADNKTSKNGVYRVVAGSFKDKLLAEKKQTELKSKGVESFLVYSDL